jgi:Glycosyl hydrolases family 31 TIM-barrel domain
MNGPRRAFLKCLPLYAGLVAAGDSVVGTSRAQPPALDRSQDGGRSDQRRSSEVAANENIEFTHFEDGFQLAAARYSVRYHRAELPDLEIYQDGRTVFRLPSVSGLWTVERREQLRDVQADPITKTGPGEYRLTVRATSSLWTDRQFHWSFSPGHIEFRHSARGHGLPGKCYFFSNGVSGPWDNGTSPGVRWNTTIFAEEYFSPAVNLADEFYFTIARPQSLGIMPENPAEQGYHPVEWSGDFAPPPLFLGFRKGSGWTGIGLGAKPGSYLFNALEYSGSRYAGASFHVDYLGYHATDGLLESPSMTLQFADDEYEAMRRYVRWLDARGFSTARKSVDVEWHHKPIFCGWGEQENQTRIKPGAPHDFCTQDNYTAWVSELESRGLPVSSIIIDDKWQSHYGTFEVDQNKWPDLAGFIRRQHDRGRHVLLWVPAYEREGLPNDLCVLDEGRPIAADVTNPKYEARLRGRIRHLVKEVGVDGFKEDWIGGVTRKASARMHAPVHGIEFERRFQFILYDETHRWKPDAMIETQTPNPLFRESSDVLRLNDIWYGARDVTRTMRRRARIAHIAGWPLVDCDDASSTDLEEWWNYMQAQPSIGIPSLYVVSLMKTTLEDVPVWDWRYLAQLWKQYIRNLNPVKPPPADRPRC